MCGISGIWNFDSHPVDKSQARIFNDSMTHRGPDGEGIRFEDSCGVALGHRRLAILDLSDKGKQPMSYGDDRYWITYNGEIYNFIELREALEKKGYTFRTDTDTEVILVSYIEWGPEMLYKFNGMWAFAIFDRIERQFFIARDRFGIKPFHYLLSPHCFAFASELKAFTRLKGFRAEIDKETAQVLLDDPFTVEASRRTLLEGVRRLQAGHYAIVKAGGITLTRWWNTSEHLITEDSLLKDPCEYFRDLFFDSVKLRMRSDVPIATCLSGGFDSTAVVCALSEIGSRNTTLRQAADWQTAFVACFPGAANDERAEAESAVNYVGINGIFLDIKESDAFEKIHAILYDFDDVYIGLPTPVWLIYESLRKHNRYVSLDGHGADELMGGYRPLEYLLFRNAPSLYRSPLRNLSLLKSFMDYSGVASSCSGFRSAVSAVLRTHPAFLSFKKVYTTCRDMFSNSFHNGFLKSEAEFEGSDFSLLGAADRLPKHWGDENRHLYRIFHSTILPTLLRNFDRLSMAHGIEVRMPFMDWRLVTFVFSLPDACKIGDGFTKRIARIAMQGRMPEQIRSSRRKVGFASPMPEWMNGVLGTWSLNLLGDKSLNGHDIVNTTKLRKFIEVHSNTESWTWTKCNAVWPYLNYLWFEKHFPNLSC